MSNPYRVTDLRVKCVVCDGLARDLFELSLCHTEHLELSAFDRATAEGCYELLSVASITLQEHWEMLATLHVTVLIAATLTCVDVTNGHAVATPIAPAPPPPEPSELERRIRDVLAEKALMWNTSFSFALRTAHELTTVATGIQVTKILLNTQFHSIY